MNAAEDDAGPARTQHAADFVATQRVAGVDPDAHHIAGLNLGGIQPRFFDLAESAWLWGGGAGLGLLGSAIAVAAEARR